MQRYKQLLGVRARTYKKKAQGRFLKICERKGHLILKREPSVILGL